MSTHVRVDNIRSYFPGVSRQSFALLSTRSDVNAAAVFVHGFGGRPASTWAEFHNVGKMSSVQTWPRTDLFFLGYRSLRTDVRGASNLILDFLRNILPTLPVDALSYRYQEKDFIVREPVRSYDKLVLIGHSMGGLVARDVVRLALRDKVRSADLVSRGGTDPELFFERSTFEYLIANAQLVLFAPAIGGMRLAGLLGVLYSFGPEGLIAWSRSKHELQQGSQVLSDIRNGTEKLAEAGFKGTKAKIAWAGKDYVVVSSEYDCDSTGEMIPSATHKSICKPSALFPFPIEFVENVHDAPELKVAGG